MQKLTFNRDKTQKSFSKKKESQTPDSEFWKLNEKDNNFEDSPRKK